MPLEAIAMDRLQAKASCTTFDQFTDLVFNALAAIYDTAADEDFKNIWDSGNPIYDFPENDETVETNKDKYLVLKNTLEGMMFTVAFPRNLDSQYERTKNYPWAQGIGQAMIGYRMYSEKPIEIKPRYRQGFRNPIDVNDYVKIFGQKFEYVTHFEVLADTAKGAEKLAEEFKKFMFEFTGYFEQQGVVDIIFRQRVINESLIEQGMYGYRLTYLVTLENLIEIHSANINKVDVTLTRINKLDVNIGDTLKTTIEFKPPEPPVEEEQLDE